MLLHFLQSKLDVTILDSFFEWNGHVIYVWAHLQLQNDSWARDLFFEKSLTHSWCAMQQSHPNQLYSPFSFSVSIRFHLPLWAGVDIRGGERETVTSGPPFPRVPFESFALCFCLAFPVIDRINFETTKQIKSIRSLCPIGRVVNIVSTHFNTIARQTTERSQRKK